ncbi:MULTISPECIES: contractile injection system tape measure protein [unclassified Tardiphaga]|uniref:contractile injection system tape measure protein n=1 Tax=unclassified Tardiphaga TaxID=2631404 RepID=UPI001164B6BF|nr:MULTISPECIES: contractile injection system tape measure protein [unclassified Tardiphaga]QDM23812.1 hypothetical protein FIU28_23625 [Tardiphaga sp. vice154]
MPHTIRQQTLDIRTDSEAAALALQAGISDINRQRLLPVIERVFDEFAVPEQRIRIARLDIDLGELPLDNFAQAAEDALYTALRAALQDALRSAADSADDHFYSETTSRLELLQHYLSQGTLPFWQSGAAFSVETLLQQLIRDDPAGLVSLIRRHSQDRRLLERLVLQLDDAALQRLLYLVTPEHAALILAYMLDLHRIHRVEPLLSLRDTAFEHLLWILVLSYLLRDAGSQFNRRSFLRWLLEGLAESESLDYQQLIETLRRGLQQMKRHQAPTSSLPAALDELLQELQVEGIADASRSAFSEQAKPGAVALTIQEVDARWPSLDELLSGTLSSALDLADRTFDEGLLRLLQDHPDRLRDFMRSHRHDARLIARLVDRLSEAALVRLLHLLEPEHAALIVAYLVDIRAVHRVTALVALDDRRFNRLLWLLVLNYVMGNPGSQFNRKSLVLSLLQGMAQSEGLDLGDLIETLRRALAAIESHLTSAASLPAIIRELAGETPAALGDDRGTAVSPDRPGFATLDHGGLLRHILQHGRLPDTPPTDDESDLRLTDLALLAPETLRAIFAGTPGPGPAKARKHLAQALPETALRALLLRLLPAAAEADPFRASLARFAWQARDRRSFYAAVLVAMLAGEVIDFAQLAVAASGEFEGSAASWPDWLPDEEAFVLQDLLLTEETSEAAAGAAARRAVVLQFLLGENARPAATDGHTPPPQAMPDDVLAAALIQTLQDDADNVGDLVRQLAQDPRQRARWIRALPGAALLRLGQVIEPRQHHALLGAAEILLSAWRQVAPHGAGTGEARDQVWAMLFDFLAAHRGIERSVEQLVADFLARVAAFGGDVATQWRAQASELARAAGNSRLAAALHEKTAATAGASIEAGPNAPPLQPRPDAPPRRTPPPPLTSKTAFSLVEDDDHARGDPIYIGNAGLVLASPFLPHLFRELDWLDVDDRKRPRLRDRDAISRAVHLLQYLVDGRSAAPEPLLVLNKILCGVPTATPVARAIVMTDQERRLGELLLRSMLDNWTVLRGTSVAGLRETFLQREGKLQRVDDGWKLRVQRRTLDVLVDQVPWSISILLAPWMPAPVHVTW